MSTPGTTATGSAWSGTRPSTGSASSCATSTGWAPSSTPSRRSPETACRVDSIQLDLSDVSVLQEESRSAAFLDARAKAGQYAALSDARLGAVMSVVEGAVAGGAPRPMMRMAMAAADSAMPVEAGEQTITATVTVTWALDGSTTADRETE